MNKKLIGLISLFITIIIFSFHVIISRSITNTANPFAVHFFRMFFAFLILLPFIITDKSWKKKKYFYLIFISTLASINWIFFMWGVSYTTASASQLIYAAMPLISFSIEKFLKKNNIPLSKIIGLIVGLGGIFYIIWDSSAHMDFTISGDVRGNILVIIAMLGWLSYTYLSKKFNRIFSIREISSSAVLTGFVLSIPLFLINLKGHNLIKLDKNSLLSYIFLGVVGTVAAQYLYQTALKHLSVLSVSFSTYIQPFITLLLAIIFLGEKITFPFLIGSMLVLVGLSISSFKDFKKVINFN